MTTWATRRTDIRSELQEATPGFWTQAELLVWGNRVYKRMYRRLRVEKSSTLSLTAGTEGVNLPSDFYLARRVELQSQVGSNENWYEVRPVSIDFRRPGDPVNALTGPPHYYYVSDGKIRFVPIPDQAYTGTLYYFARPTALSADGDALVYPDGVDAEVFDEVFDQYVIAQALRKRQDPAYTTYLGDHAAGLNALIADAERRGQSAPQMVIDDWASE